MATLAPRGAQQPAPAAGAVPRVHDERLELRLFAADPEIATPIGIAVDAVDRVFVLESHTHLPPPGYRGPSSDRIKVFVDADRDGRAEKHWVFADGFEDGMNLAFAPDGELYLLTARGVWAVHDRDGDGVSDGRTRVLHLARPDKVYDHAALLGLTFSSDGWLYVSRGNTGGAAWRLEGTDGSAVHGYGDGGNIMRSRPDGSRLEQVATGFWNPFDIKFDPYGRLLAVDNDPDARGPNRLVHVIAGGDYGYKALYGESGVHPYVAWNGELPGTLPYAAPLGEAPAGLLSGRYTSLPADYADDLLVSIWEERRVVRVATERSGTTLRGEARTLIDGDERFRPVALAADSGGTVYFTDWAQRQYPNHGHGRIWRLAAQHGVPRLKPRPQYATPLPDEGIDRLRALADGGVGFDGLRQALTSGDAFERSAAITALAGERFRERVLAATSDADPAVRTGTALALQRSGAPSPEPVIRTLLADGDPAVRATAMMWAGSARLAALEPAIEAAVLTLPTPPQLFAVFLATVEQFNPEFTRAYETQSAPYARQLKRVLRPRFLEAFIADAAKPAALRAAAVRHLRPDASAAGFLVRLVASGQPLEIRREAVHSLYVLEGDGASQALEAVASDRGADPTLRADALSALARQKHSNPAAIVPLLEDPVPAVRLEAARYLRAAPMTPALRRRAARRSQALTAAGGAPVVAQLAFVLGRPPATPPLQDAAAWERALAKGAADADTGRRVFFSPAAVCSECHVMEGRGGALGPDLTNVSQSKTRQQILRSILDPSAEVSPDYQGWFLRTASGIVHTGRQIDVGENGKADLYVLGRGFITIGDMRDYGPMDRSLMPDGLATNLSVDDIRHLLAYLEAAGDRSGTGR